MTRARALSLSLSRSLFLANSLLVIYLNLSYNTLVQGSRGDWVEVNDADGSLLGEEYSGKTLYFHRRTTELSEKRPSGWVRMQVRSSAVLIV